MRKNYAAIRDDLSDLLWNISLMRTAENRDAILAELDIKGHSITRPSAMTENRLQCNRILDETMNHRGALKCLARVLYKHDGRSIHSTEFLRRVEDWLPSDFITLSERAQFIADLNSFIRDSDITRYYRIVTDEMPAGTFEDLAELVGELERIAIPDSCHPLIVLAETVATESRVPGAADVCRRWADNLARTIDETHGGTVSDEERAKLRSLRTKGVDLSRAETGPATIVLQLDPAPPRPDHYLLSAWIHLGSIIRDQIGEIANPLSIDAIQPAAIDVINDGIMRIENLDEHATEIVLEFVLPRDLLSFPVEYWADDLARYRSLGVQFIVVVRDLIRQRDPRMRFAQRGKWINMIQGDTGADTRISRWITCGDEPYDSGELYKRLLADECVSVGLTFPPSRGTHGFQLAEMLDAGTPVAVWPRRCDHAGAQAEGGADWCRGESFKNELCRRLADRPLRDLPRLVRDLRREVIRPDDPGGGMIILWDDAMRRAEPEDFSLDRPASRDGV